MNKRQRKKRDKALEERLRRENEQLRQENARLEKENARLQERLSKLEGRLGQTSLNSSKPPSSDPSWTRNNRSSGAGTGNKPGGQPGHAGHKRELAPPERVNKTVVVKPEQCRGCGARLSGDDPHPHRHQVTAIPKVEPHISEYQLHTLSCAKCHLDTRAVLPEGVPAGAFAPSVVAIVSLLTSFYRLGRRPAAAAMWDLFSVKMSVGSITACEGIASAALEAPVAEARAHVKDQQVKHADETSWYEGPTRKTVWLWTVLTERVTVFLIRASRGTQVAKDMLGQVHGVLVTDRWCAYAWWPIRWRQLCWAHLKRHFQEFKDAGGRAGRIGQALLKEEKLLFELWHRVRDGTLARSTFRIYAAPLRRRVEALLREGAGCGHAKTAATCRDILKLAPGMWTFVRREGVSPTNNAAERAIRPSVLWRRICFGTHSEAGSRFAERIMTVSCTLKQQGRNVVDYVTRSVEAHMRGDSAQSLLPNTAR